MYDKYQQKQQVYESKINPKLMNQQRSNNTKSKNAKMKRAQESHFTWVECKRKCCKKRDWSFRERDWVVVCVGQRLARAKVECEWEWVRHGNGVWQESEFRLGVSDLKLGEELGKWEWDRDLGFCKVRVWGQWCQAWVEVKVRGWASWKTRLKSPNRPRATLPPGGRSRAARRYTGKITLGMFSGVAPGGR